jgi:hypothetical protein
LARRKEMMRSGASLPKAVGGTSSESYLHEEQYFFSDSSKRAPIGSRI